MSVFQNLLASGALGQLGAGLLSARGGAGVNAGFQAANAALQGYQQQQQQKTALQGLLGGAGLTPQQTAVLGAMPYADALTTLQGQAFPKFDKDRMLLEAIGDPHHRLNAAARVAMGLDADKDTLTTQSGLNARHNTLSADAAASQEGQNRRHLTPSGTARLNEAGRQDRFTAQEERQAREFLATNSLARDKYEQDKQEFGQTFALSQLKVDMQGDQFDRTHDLNTRKVDIGVDEFGRTHDLNVDRFVHGVEQDARTLAVAQQNADTAEFRVNNPTPKAATESERKIERLQSIGIPYAKAVKISSGVLKVVRDPLTGEATVVDLSTNTPDPSIPPDVVVEAQEQLPKSTPVNGAFGIEGAAKGAINAVGDSLGLGTAFPDVQTTQADFDVLREQLINDVASAYARQPPSWLLKNIEGLTPQAGSIRQGESGAKSQLNALRRSFEGELENAQKRSRQRLSPTERQALEAKMSGVSASLARIDAALDRFDTGGGNVTSSGVKWSVK